MLKKYARIFSILILGVAFISLSGCVTGKAPYRRELSHDAKLSEANASYKKAINWLDKAESSPIPYQAKESYTTADSYLSDTIFKLKKAGNDNNMDVSENVYYCENIKRETAVKIGQADRVGR